MKSKEIFAFLIEMNYLVRILRNTKRKSTLDIVSWIIVRITNYCTYCLLVAGEMDD